MKKRIIIILGALLVVLGVTYFGVGNYFYNFALKANDEKEFMEDNPNLEESIAVMAAVSEAAELADNQFKNETDALTMSIVSKDSLQLNLKANFYENGKIIINTQ